MESVSYENTLSSSLPSAPRNKMAPGSTQASMSPTSLSVLALLPKLTDPDPDLRYMSLNDLYSILALSTSNVLVNEYHTSTKTVECLLRALDDKNGEVQNQAIKWLVFVVPCCCPLTILLFSLGALTLKLPTDVLPPLVEKLSNLKTTNSVDRSIPSTALRTFIISFPPAISGVPPSKATMDAYSAISKVLIPRLVGYVVIPHGLKNHPLPPVGMLQVDSETGVDSDAIDVLIELIRCFGSMLQDSEKNALQKAIISIFDSDRTNAVAKKKAVVAISTLAAYLPDDLLASLVSNTIEGFRNDALTLERRKLLITIVGSLARSAPRRIGPHLKTIAPLLLGVLSEEEYKEALDDLVEDGAPNPELEEVREAALVALDGFLSCCSNDMRLFTDEAIAAALRYLAYDPNNATDENDEEMGGTQGDGSDDDETNEIENDEDEDFIEEGALSDDDDASWKLRRCAAKALCTIISTRSNGDLLENGVLYERIAPVLITRFREREENVRLEVLAALSTLIQKTGEGISSPTTNEDRGSDSATSHTSVSRKRRRVSSSVGSLDLQRNLSISSVGVTSPVETPSPTSGPYADLAALSPTIIREVAKLLKQSSIPSKKAAITVIYKMVVVRHGGLSIHLSKLIEPILDIVKPSSAYSAHGSTSASGGSSSIASKLRIEALQLITKICDTHSSTVLASYMEDIIPEVVAAVTDKYYKVSSEAIRVVESIIKVLTPLRSASIEQKHLSHIIELHDVILGRAVANDADLEVRQRAIHALGVLLARTSGSNTQKLIPSAKKVNALNVLQDRLKNEITRLSAIQAVDIVCASARDMQDLQPEWVRAVALELGAQLRKADRILRGASLCALRNLTANFLALASLDEKTVNDLAYMLLPLVNASDLNLLGMALVIYAKLIPRSPRKVVNEDLNDAICTIVLAPLGGVVMDSLLVLVKVIGEQGVGQLLMHGLLKNVGVSGDPAIVGKATGVLLVSGASTVGIRVDDFIMELKTSRDEQRKCLALSILGEAGLRLGSLSPLKLQPSIFTTHFNSKSEQVPRAAAIALGRAGAGNIDAYLPVILSTSDASGSSQYLSLHSIKEILQHAVKAKIDLSPYTRQIWDRLIIASQSEDNKAVGAECIGKLAIIEPRTFLPLLQVISPQAAVRYVLTCVISELSPGP